MKIAYLIPHLLALGGIRRIIELTNSLVDLGHSVYLFSETEDRYSWPLIKAEVLPWKDRTAQSFDICCFSLESQYKEPKEVKAKAVIYYILHYGAIYKIPEICKESYKQPYYRIVNSRWTAEHIQKETGEIPMIVRGAVNRQYFYPMNIEKEYDLLCYGDKKRPWKGTKELEEVAERAGLKLEKYEGKNLPQTKMGEEYSKARIFLSGSKYEGWNWPCLEAMACGVPVIKTPDGGSADYTRNDINCIECSYNDMTEAIKKISTDDKLRKRLIREGLKTASEYSSSIEFAKQFEFHCKAASGLL